jgi:hypothetical protein
LLLTSPWSSSARRDGERPGWGDAGRRAEAGWESWRRHLESVGRGKESGGGESFWLSLF